MASLFDKLETPIGKTGKTREQFRLNKVFIKPEDVPENVKRVLTLDNFVDEHGNIVVDNKNEAARKPAEDETPEDTQPAEPAKPTNKLDTGEGVQTNEPDPDEDPTSVPSAPVVADTPEEDSEPDTPAAPEPAQAPVPQAPARVAQPVGVFKSKVPQSSPGMGFPRKHGKTVDIFDLVTPHTHVKLIGGQTVPLSAHSFKAKTEGQIISRLKELGIETIDFQAAEDAQNAPVMAGGNSPDLLMEADEIDEDIKLG